MFKSHHIDELSALEFSFNFTAGLRFDKRAGKLDLEKIRVGKWDLEPLRALVNRRTVLNLVPRAIDGSGYEIGLYSVGLISARGPINCCIFLQLFLIRSNKTRPFVFFCRKTKPKDECGPELSTRRCRQAESKYTWYEEIECEHQKINIAESFWCKEK